MSIIRFAFLRSDKRNNVTVERVGSTDFPRHEMKRRVSNYLSYLALAVPRALAIRPDVVLAMTDPPVAGIAGAFVARMSGRPFVYNIRDMYPDMALGGDIVRANSLVARWEEMHRRALREAARVIVLGDDMRERILAKGVAPERVVVVRDGAATFGAAAGRHASRRGGSSLRISIRRPARGQSWVLRRMVDTFEGGRIAAQRKHRARVCG